MTYVEKTISPKSIDILKTAPEKKSDILKFNCVPKFYLVLHKVKLITLLKNKFRA